MMSRAPIVFFDFVTHYGGSNKSTVLLIRELQKLAPVMVLDAYGTCSEYLADLRRQGTPYRIVSPNARFVTVGGRSRLQRGLNVLRSLPEMVGMVRSLRKLIAEISPRALWVNSEKALFMASRAVGGTIPMALYVRGQLRHISRWAKGDWRRLRLIVSNSRKGLDYLQTLDGMPVGHVIYNGVDMEDIMEQSTRPTEDLPLSGNPLKVALPASLIPLKNHAMAIRGLANYLQAGGEAVLWICGDIPNAADHSDVSAVLALPDQLGISAYVHFLGWQQNVPAILRQADVMTLTSRTEGMPRAVMEAMALEKPVLVTDVGGVSELVRDGIDGIVVPSEGVAEFTMGLRRLADPQVRQTMGQAARRRIAEQFSLAEQAKRFHDMLSAL